MAETDVEAGTAGKEVAIKTPLGEVNVKGYHFGNLLQIIQVFGLVFLCYLIWQQKDALSVAAATTAVSVKVEHETINKSINNQTAAITAQTEVLAENSYILTLNQTQRERLNMQMPSSLRRRIIGRDQ